MAFYENNDLSYNATGARYGYNSQEQSTELNLDGNHTTAEFWEYDARSARRWNLDPVDQISKSNYSTFGNNPIMNNDLNGDDDFNVTGTDQSADDVNSPKHKNYRIGVQMLADVINPSGVKSVDFNFNWNSEYPHFWWTREKAANQLANYIIERNTPGTDIYIYGYSFGGEPALLAVPIIKDKLKELYGEEAANNTKIHVVTLSTPLDLEITDDFMNSKLKNVSWTHIYSGSDQTVNAANFIHGTNTYIPDNYLLANFFDNGFLFQIENVSKKKTYTENSSIKFVQMKIKKSWIKPEVKEAMDGNNHGWPFWPSIMEELVKEIKRKN